MGVFEEDLFEFSFEHHGHCPREYNRDHQFAPNKSAFTTHPLLGERWKDFQPELGSSSRNASGPGQLPVPNESTAEPAGSASISQSTAPEPSRVHSAPQLRHADQEDRSKLKRTLAVTEVLTPTKKLKTESHTETASPSGVEVDQEYRSQCTTRFDPRFLTIQVKDGSSLTSDRLDTHVKKFEKSTPLRDCQRLLFRQTLKQPKESAYSDLLVPLLEFVGNLFYGGHASGVVENGGHILKKDDQLSSDDAHLDWKKGESDCKPDIVITQGERNDRERNRVIKEFEHLRTFRLAKRTIEIKRLPRAEFASHYPPTSNENTVPRVMKYLGATVRNRPLSGRVFALSICGPAVRLWTADASSFASSRVYSLLEPKDYRELLIILAFFLYPGDRYDQRWTPSRKFRTRCHQTNQTEDVQVGPATLLEVRSPLFGSRTTVWRAEQMGANSPQPSAPPVQPGLPLGTNDVSETGTSDRRRSARIVSSQGPIRSESLDKDEYVIKATWLTPDLVHHEETMLHLLHTGAAVSLQPLASSCVSEQVRSHIPKLVGTVEDEKLKEWATVEIVGQDAAEPARPPLHLSILVTTCRIGRRLPMVVLTTDRFSYRNYGQVFLGIVECLWFSASKGIHYRDLNLGNVMWRWLPDGKTVIAWLVDWGNARYLQAPRAASSRERTLHETIKLAEDDGRSANPYFQSLPCAGARKLRDDYMRLASDYSNAEETARTKGIDPRVYKPCIHIQRNIQRKLDEARRASHRYIDDLQSLIFLICYVMSLKLKKEDIVFDMEELLDLEKKKEEWNAGCVNLAANLDDNGLGAPTSAWCTFIKESAKLVRDARTALDHLSDIPDQMHEIENQCFYDLHVLTKATLDDMSEVVLG